VEHVVLNPASITAAWWPAAGCARPRDGGAHAVGGAWAGRGAPAYIGAWAPRPLA